MANKNYAVIILPKHGQENSIEIDKNNIYENINDAFEAVDKIVFNETGKHPYRPKTSSAYSVETPNCYVQIWVCDIPFVNP